jgi:hypothetical protein
VTPVRKAAESLQRPFEFTTYGNDRNVGEIETSAVYTTHASFRCICG